jgi:hypothetical protein
MYIVFLRNRSGIINLEINTGEFGVKWFDLRNGGTLQPGSVKTVSGGKLQKLNGAPSELEKDWVVLLRKK